MLLNPYRFYIPSGIYDPDAESLFSRMVVQPSETLKVRIHNLITGLKFYNVWPKIDSFIMAKALHTLQAALLDWKRNVSAEVIGDVLWNPGEGFIGGGSDDAVINTNFIPSIDGVNYTLNSFGTGCYVSRPGTYVAGDLFGVSSYIPPLNEQRNMYITADNLVYGLYAYANGSKGPENTTLGYATTGFFELERVSDTLSNLYRDGQLLDSDATPPNGLPTISVALMGINDIDTGYNNSFDGAEGMWYAGARLDDVEKAILRTLVKEFWLYDFSAENLFIPSTQYLEVGPSVIQPIEYITPTVELLQVNYI